MPISPLPKFLMILMLAAIASTAVYSQSTKSKKGSSGDQGSSTADQSSADGKDGGSGGNQDKSGGKDASKSDDQSKGDTSKAGFDDGTYAEATAISYKAMQSMAKKIARAKGSAGNTKVDTYVVFDPTTFASIAQYRIQFPQIVLLRASGCGMLHNMDAEKRKEKKDREAANPELVRPSAGGGDGTLAGLSPAGQIVDLAQKVLTMMQTSTTIAGATVNVTDEALVAEVAASLVGADGKPAVFYPGEFLLPDIGEEAINSAMNDAWCEGAQPLGVSHHIVAEVIRLGVEREEAASRYQLLTAALNKYNSLVNPSVNKENTEQPAPSNQAEQTDKPKKPKKTNGAGAAPPVAVPTPATPGTNPAHPPTAQEKRNALDQFFAETGFTDTVKATGYQANLKSHMDAYDALLTVLATPDSKGQTTFSRLVIAERLDSILKPPAIPDPNDATKTIASSVVVVIVKWLRAGALNKTRKNLFFLGQRNYYAGGATVLYEYFDADQKMLTSGTITETSPFIHDKDFDKQRKVTTIDLATTP